MNDRLELTPTAVEVRLSVPPFADAVTGHDEASIELASWDATYAIVNGPVGGWGPPTCARGTPTYGQRDGSAVIDCLRAAAVP